MYLAKMEEKFELLKHGTDTAISSAVDTMVGKLGARWNTPSRCSDLSSKEEQIRCELTWQNWDERLWIAGCAGEKELSDWVADAKEFARKRDETWLMFSDQIQRG